MEGMPWRVNPETGMIETGLVEEVFNDTNNVVDKSFKTKRVPQWLQPLKRSIPFLNTLPDSIQLPDAVAMLDLAVENNLNNGGEVVANENFFDESTLNAMRQAVLNSKARLDYVDDMTRKGKSVEEELYKQGVQPFDYHVGKGVGNRDTDYYYGNVLANKNIPFTPMFQAVNSIGSFHYSTDENGNIIVQPDRYDFGEPEKSDRGAFWNLGRMSTSGNNVPIMSVNLGNPNDWNFDPRQLEMNPIQQGIDNYGKIQTQKNNGR